MTTVNRDYKQSHTVRADSTLQTQYQPQTIITATIHRKLLGNVFSIEFADDSHQHYFFELQTQAMVKSGPSWIFRQHTHYTYTSIYISLHFILHHTAHHIICAIQYTLHLTTQYTLAQICHSIFYSPQFLSLISDRLHNVVVLNLECKLCLPGQPTCYQLALCLKK